MSTPNYSNLNQKLIAFLAGDQRAGAALYKEARSSIMAVARKRAPDLRNDLEDVASEVFILMMEAPHRFDPARASASTFILTVLVPEAIQRMRAKMARPGSTTRRRAAENRELDLGLSVMPAPLPIPDMIPSAGYGSPEAIEAACDARVILTRATPPMRLIIGGLMEGKSQGEIAVELNMNRFQVARMIAGLQRQFAAAA